MKRTRIYGLAAMIACAVLGVGPADAQTTDVPDSPTQFQRDVPGDYAVGTGLRLVSADGCPVLRLADPPADLSRIAADNASQRVVGHDIVVHDLDGDGIAEIIVSAPDSDAGGLSEAGTVTIWKGPLEEGRTAGFSTAGVVLSGPAARAHLGTAIVADWNGDGKSDLVLGAYGVSKCYVLLGPIQLNGSHRINDVADVTLLAASGSRAGASLASGDVDADGIDDLLIVAPSLDITGRSNVNACYIALGRRTPNAEILLDQGIRIVGIDSGDGYASGLNGRCAASGDLNGDSIADVVISAPFADGPGNSRSGAGEVAVVWGRALWPAQVDLRTDAAVIIYGDHAGDRLMARCTVRARGADYDDLLLFAPLADAPGGDRNGSGLGYVVRGSSNWMPVHDVGQIARQTIVGASPNGALSHGAFLDLNEDGDFEILCGSYLDPGVDNQRPDGGVLHIVPTARVGTMVDLATDPCWQVLSAGAQDWLTGYGAMQLGDVDDDGRAELLIAASRAEGITGVGAVYAFEPAALLATDPSTIDLAPVDLDLAGEFTTESRLTVSYAVRQTGIGTATGTVWHDRVVFSRNSRLGDADDLILEDVEVAQPLQPGMEYRSVVDVPLSALMAGNGHIGLLINADASVPECLGRDNNSILQSVVITAPTREPDPDRSTVPAECLIGPDESATLFVILRDENGEPIPHLAGTFLDFEGVEGLRFCVPPASWPILKGSKSDSQGRVRFLLRGGGCVSGAAAVRWGRLELGTVQLRSMDQDGDLRLGFEDLITERCPSTWSPGGPTAEEWDLVVPRVGQGCGLRPSRLVDLKLRISKPHIRIIQGDTITVVAKLVNRDIAPVAVDSVVFEGKLFGLGGGWNTLHTTSSLVLPARQASEVGMPFTYPLGDRHWCFRVHVYFDDAAAQAASGASPAADDTAPLGTVLATNKTGIAVSYAVESDVVGRHAVLRGTGGEELYSLPFDGLGGGDFEHVRILGYEADELVEMSAFDRAQFMERLREPDAQEAAYLWQNGPLTAGSSAVEDTLLNQAAITYAQTLYLLAPVTGESTKESIPCRRNGCGPDPLRGTIEGWINAGGRWFGGQLNFCCNDHDCCYHGTSDVGGTATGCGELDRAICDVLFLDCMALVCDVSEYGTENIARCKERAMAMFVIVREFMGRSSGNYFNWEGCDRPPAHMRKSRQINTQSVARGSKSQSWWIPYEAAPAETLRVHSKAILPAGWTYSLAGGEGQEVTGSGSLRVDVQAADGDTTGTGRVILVALSTTGEYVAEAEIAIVDPDAPAVPPSECSGVRIESIFPQPCLRSAEIKLSVGQAGNVETKIVDLRGRVVRVLLQGWRAAGTESLVWDGADDAGRRVASGLYFAVAAGSCGTRDVQRITMLR